MAIHGHIMAIYGHTHTHTYIYIYMGIYLWPYMVIYDHIYITIYDHQHGHIWPYMTIYGHAWPYIYGHGLLLSILSGRLPVMPSFEHNRVVCQILQTSSSGQTWYMQNKAFSRVVWVSRMIEPNLSMLKNRRTSKYTKLGIYENTAI